ncbi:MAG: tetratricopeptide repeat protein [Candidatus Methylomirabilales bacterium]
MWLTRGKSYDRFDILAAAEKARSKGRLRKAIAEYRKVLDVDPDDHVIHGKVAPLLAERKRLDEAWSSFVAAGDGYNQHGYINQAVSIYTQAARYLPRKREVWETIARLQEERGLPADGVKALLDGTRYFRRRDDRPEALHLLRLACKIQPWHFEATFLLAKVLAKAGDKGEAQELLTELAERVQGRNRRRARAALFRMSPSLGAAWHWVRAAIAAREIPFPRPSSWAGSGVRRARRGRTARVICLTIALWGAILVGLPFRIDVGPQMVSFLLGGGSGLVVVGLTSFLFFSRRRERRGAALSP